MSSSTPFRPPGLRNALNREWADLVSDEAPLPAHWRYDWSVLASCCSLRELPERIWQWPDPVLQALLSMCAGGDQLAGRVVLQAMLGKLVRMAASDVRAGLDDYVSAMWLQIRTYPLAERPVRIPANLALDTLKAVRRNTLAVQGIEVTPYPPSAFVEGLREPVEPPGAPEPVDSEVAARRVLQAAARLGLITEDTRAVLTSVYADGLTGASAAARHGKSPGAIRVQCHKAIRILAQHAQALAEVA